MLRSFGIQVHDGTRHPTTYRVRARSLGMAEQHAVKHHRRTTGRRVSLTVKVG